MVTCIALNKIQNKFVALHYHSFMLGSNWLFHLEHIFASLIIGLVFMMRQRDEIDIKISRLIECNKNNFFSLDYKSIS